MKRFRDLTFDEAIEGLKLYRPVIALVAFIALLLVVLPGGEEHRVGVAGGDPSAGQLVAGKVPTEPTTSDLAGRADLPLGDVPGVTFTGTSDTSFLAPPRAPATGADDTATRAPVDQTTTIGLAPAPRAQPLTIVASGYASRTGGTPAEQNPPNNGLPVAAAANQDAKRSYLKLSGDKLLLRLKLVGDANQNINADTAAINVCPVTTGEWQPARGQGLDAGPAFDAGKCQAGTKTSATTWDFDLTRFGRPGDVPGFALTPAAAPGNAFQVVFEPLALPTDG